MAGLIRGIPGAREWCDALDRIAPSPIHALNRAVAEAYLHGPQAELDRPRGPGVNTMAGKTPKQSAKIVKKAAAKRVAAKPTVLAGGNPQIAKADGDAPVQAYIAAMPGWKSGVGRRLDALIVRTVPGVRKAVNWNSPFY